MHSDTTEKFGSPRKRTICRAMSEEESLRHIIQEAEETPKRLSRRNSRCGSLRRGDTRGSQSEDEPTENTAVVDLQEDNEALLAELQSVERHQGVLMFQLDCLQDALEGAEEALAETQRENHQISTELEREREQRRKLEVMVETLKQEVERLKEEKNSVPAERVVEDKIEVVGAKDSPEVSGDTSTETDVKSVDAVPEPTVSRATESAASPAKPSAGSSAGSPAGSPVGPAALFAAGGLLVSFFKHRKSDPNLSKPAEPKPQPVSQGSSVDQDAGNDQAVQSDPAAVEENSGKAPDAEENDESSGYEDAPADFSPGSSTPDGLTYAGMPEDELRELRGSSGDGNNPEACVLS